MPSAEGDAASTRADRVQEFDTDTINHPRLGKPSMTWAYRGRGGELLGCVRFDPPGGRKQVLPLTPQVGPEGPRWEWKSWAGPRPLYGLDRLARRPLDTVVVVEGEKCADAAGAVFPFSTIVTSPGGASAAAKADWSMLQGREVFIWPDVDKPGLAYAEQVASLLCGVAKSIQIFDAQALAHTGPEGEERQPRAGISRMLSKKAGSLPISARRPWG